MIDASFRTFGVQLSSPFQRLDNHLPTTFEATEVSHHVNRRDRAVSRGDHLLVNNG